MAPKYIYFMYNLDENYLCLESVRINLVSISDRMDGANVLWRVTQSLMNVLCRIEAHP
mgnify:CR=1 FL=1